MLPLSRLREQDAVSSDRDYRHYLPELECEYCFKREKELCSPLVVDLSAEEAEEFLKHQEAVRAFPYECGCCYCCCCIGNDVDICGVSATAIMLPLFVVCPLRCCCCCCCILHCCKL